LWQKVRIGNFVEVKNSLLHEGVKANHLAYIGDSDIGAGTNFSCGAITANYDGYDKFKTVIGDNVMVGSNVTLVAPIQIGSGAYLAAGSTITKDVPAEALSVERAETRLVPGWAEKNRNKKQKPKNKA
jgi:bifunctional UDP-N-acetylglucosamine pyrophosphorylase/glucosamine-1-phosphate N-acetyltransferase